MSDPNRGTLDFNESFDVHFDNLYDEKNSEVGILASGNIGPDEFDIKINYPVDEKIFVKYCGQDIELTVGNMKITGSLGTRDVSVLVDQGLDLENNVYFSMEGYVGDDSFRVDNRVIRWGAGVYRGNGSKNSLVVILSILIWTTAFYEF